MNKPIALNVVAGFLGSGKTSLLQSVLSGLGGERVTVLVNEFGEVGIDGESLKQGSLEVVELTGGCVCCVMRGNLTTALRDIAAKIAPDRLIIETTGVAQPLDVLEALQVPSLSPLYRVEPVVVVVDVTFLPSREYLGAFYDNQVRTADILLLNKVDLATDAERAEGLALLKSLNPYALIMETVRGVIDPSLLFASSLSAVFDRLQNEQLPPNGQEAESPEFKSLAFTDEMVFDEGKFKVLLQQLPDSVFRAKGYVNFASSTAFLNYAAGRYELEDCSERRNNRLVMIGAPLATEALLENIRSCASEVILKKGEAGKRV